MAMAWLLERDLRHLDVDQASIQAELDTDFYLHLPPGCGSVRVNETLYGLTQQRGSAWYQILSPTLVECGFEKCLVDLCVV
ncbi:unnamed protein product [Sphacelaria rigidula]